MVRHKKVLSDNIQGITKPALRRISLRAGIKRMSAKSVDESRGILRQFLRNVVRDSVIYTEYANRKTVSDGDVREALRRNGRPLWA